MISRSSPVSDPASSGAEAARAAFGTDGFARGVGAARAIAGPVGFTSATLDRVDAALWLLLDRVRGLSSSLDPIGTVFPFSLNRVEPVRPLASASRLSRLVEA